MYRRYAEVYDRSGQIQFSLRMIPYMAKVLERHGWHGQSVLDLACGTGTLAVSFAEQGLRVFGVDASENMLAQAQRKADEAGKAVELSQQDMRDFALPEQVDLVTCCYDSLNYMLSVEDLTQTFRHVHAALKPGGLFAFDLNSAWLYENTQNDTFFSESDGLASVIYCAYEPDTRMSTASIVCFVRRGDEELYERLSETHVQRAHQDDEVADSLRAAHLAQCGRYHCFGFNPPGEGTPRVMWVARRGDS